MKPEFTLFLDESANKLSDDLFCISGCIIKNTNLPTLDEEINEIKKLIWTQNEMETLDPILHSTELNVAYNNRKNPKISGFTKGAYTVFNTKSSSDISQIYKSVYAKFSALIKNQNIITLCCIIDRQKFKSYYSLPSQPRLIDDWYDIAMQEILESYVHYLCKVDGVGSVIYEARSDSSTNASTSLDNKMFHNFCKVKVNGKGVAYLTNRTIYERIRFLNIVTKKDNHSGLQLADFIAFNYIKWFLRNENDRTDFMKRIHLAAYNGSHDLATEDLRECWGVRVLPNDVFKVQNLQSELKTLRKSYANLKSEKTRVNQKLNNIIKEKHALQEKYNDLLAKQSKNQPE